MNKNDEQTNFALHLRGRAPGGRGLHCVRGKPSRRDANVHHDHQKEKVFLKVQEKSEYEKGQTVPTPDRIREIQTALQKDGSYQGEPTGKWDDATANAMKKYQDKIGVSPTGKIDAVSLNKLGLGSDTAGKGAPVPAASSSVAPADPPAK